MTATAWTQADSQFYEDGTESGAATLGSQGGNITRGTGDTFSIRLEVTVTGMQGNLNPILRYSHEGGTYTRVNATSNFIQSGPSDTLTDDDPTTERLAGPNTFVAGEIDDIDSSTSTISLEDDPQEDTEILFSLTIVDADVADGETIDLRCYNSGVELDAYTVTPRITVSKPAGAGGRLLLLNPPGLDGGMGGGLSL